MNNYGVSAGVSDLLQTVIVAERNNRKENAETRGAFLKNTDKLT